MFSLLKTAFVLSFNFVVFQSSGSSADVTVFLGGITKAPEDSTNQYQSCCRDRGVDEECWYLCADNHQISKKPAPSNCEKWKETIIECVYCTFIDDGSNGHLKRRKRSVTSKEHKIILSTFNHGSLGSPKQIKQNQMIWSKTNPKLNL